MERSLQISNLIWRHWFGASASNDLAANFVHFQRPLRCPIREQFVKHPSDTELSHTGSHSLPTAFKKNQSGWK